MQCRCLAVSLASFHYMLVALSRCDNLKHLQLSLAVPGATKPCLAKKPLTHRPNIYSEQKNSEANSGSATYRPASLDKVQGHVLHTESPPPGP